MVGKEQLSQSEARAAILNAIAVALHTRASLELPEVQPVFPGGPNVELQSLAREFQAQLAAVSGEAKFLSSVSDVAAAIQSFVEERGLIRIVAQDLPLVRSALARVSGELVIWATAAARNDVAAADCGVIEAQALIANTGAAVAVLPTYAERLLPYLPRTCVIVADANVLCTNLNGRPLDSIARAARERATGEAVIIAGPSRSADIEKVLVLGAHGPQTVAVFVSGLK